MEILVYFFTDIYDYTVSYTLSKEYYKSLDAPRKGIYTFENTAHSPKSEEPAKVQRILKEDVLAGKDKHAD